MAVINKITIGETTYDINGGSDPEVTVAEVLAVLNGEEGQE